MNSGFYRHSRQQALQQWLSLVELDANRDALYDLGEIAGGIVGRQQRELRSTGRRYSLDAAMQLLVRESVDCDVDGMAWTNSRELRLLVVGDHVHAWQRHDFDQIAPDVDVVTWLNLPFTNDAIKRCDDLGVAELEPGRGQRGLGPLQVRRALLLGSGQHLELVALCRNQCPARANIRLCARVACSGLFQLLPGAGFGLGQRLLPLLLLTGFDLLSER